MDFRVYFWWGKVRDWTCWISGEEGGPSEERDSQKGGLRLELSFAGGVCSPCFLGASRLFPPEDTEGGIRVVHTNAEEIQGKPISPLPPHFLPGPTPTPFGFLLLQLQFLNNA